LPGTSFIFSGGIDDSLILACRFCTLRDNSHSIKNSFFRTVGDSVVSGARDEKTKEMLMLSRETNFI